MAQAGIPPTHRAAFARLASLTDDEFDGMVRSLADSNVMTSRPRLVADLTTRLGLDTDEASRVVGALIGAHHVRRWRDLTPEAAAELLASGDELALTDDERVLLRERLLLVLREESLGLMAKAVDVLTENERVLHEARIVTDVRPVFLRAATEEPSGWVIVQTLKVDLHRDARRENVYVAMDMTDLRKLRAVLDRAIDKAETLERVMAAIDLPIIDLGGEGA